MIKIIFFGPLEKWAGKRSYMGEGKNIEELFKNLELQIGKSLIDHLTHIETGSVKSHFHILLNGIDTDSETCLTTPLKKGDIITVVPPIGGG
ncbi:MAG: MoaD/ThiS family protein [Candidatus Hodarchaeales archaeon]